MGRLSIKIKVPIDKREDFLTLCQDVVNYNNLLGPASPLASGDVVNMAAFEAQVQQARQCREEALKHYAEAEALMEKSRVLMGVNAGQTSKTPGTLYYQLLRIKGLLLVLNTFNPTELLNWGFKVVVRSTRAGRRKKQPNLPA